MSRTELERLSDHDLLILLHERFDNHLRNHDNNHRFAIWIAGLTATSLIALIAAHVIVVTL